MTVSLLHTTPADGTFSAQGATAWDAEHALTMAGSGKVLGRTTAGTGAVEELTEITLASGTKTASAPVMDMTQTWNNAAVTFTGWKFNVTDTASNAASLLMDLQVGGVSKANISKSSIMTLPSGAIQWKSGSNLEGLYFEYTNGTSIFGNNARYAHFSSSVLSLGNLQAFCFSTSSQASPTSNDLFLTRRAAANLRLGNADAAAPVAQTLSVQSVVAGTSNTAGANLTITGSQGTGTGAGGSIIFQVAPAGSSGTAQNALATALTINGNKTFNFQGALYDSVNNLTFGSTSSTVVAAVTNSSSTGSPSSFALANSYALAWSSTSNPLGVLDVLLYRDAANTLALRNGANTQTFNLYKTYTNASNYQRVALYGSAGNNIVLEQQVAGTGVAGDFYIGNSSGSSNVIIQTGAGIARWKWDSNGHFLANADNTYDIGASGASRPRNVHVAGTVIPGRGVTVAGLPTPSTGMIARVTDALVPTIGATVTGGGAAYALVNYNGANWTVIGV